MRVREVVSARDREGRVRKDFRVSAGWRHGNTGREESDLWGRGEHWRAVAPCACLSCLRDGPGLGQELSKPRAGNMGSMASCVDGREDWGWNDLGKM